MYNQRQRFINSGKKNQWWQSLLMWREPFLRLPFQASLHKHTDSLAVQSCSRRTCRCIFPADTDRRLDWWRRSSCYSPQASPPFRSEPEASAVDDISLCVTTNPGFIVTHMNTSLAFGFPHKEESHSSSHWHGTWVTRRGFFLAFYISFNIQTPARVKSAASGQNSVSLFRQTCSFQSKLQQAIAQPPKDCLVLMQYWLCSHTCE